MPRLIKRDIALIVGDNDAFVEGKRTKIAFYKDDDGDIVFKVMAHSGLLQFLITNDMAKELVEKLGSMVDE